jgi:hypothetical protein
MADPHVYPEAPSAPLTLPIAVGLPTPTFTPIEQLAALDPATSWIPKTMFIRVALSGANCGSKLADSIVALGVAGSLAVAVNNMAVVAAGDDDVTAFVVPGRNRCAYRVEVYVPATPSSSAAGPTGWVTIGTSAGVTQSFSLLRAKMRMAAAIRVTDLSRQTRGPDLKPLTAPGVGIRGIGVLKVTDKIPWGLDGHLQFLTKPDN